MANSDKPGMEIGDLGEALALLTRLPISSDNERGVRAAWAWPIAGGVAAFIAAIMAQILLVLGTPPILAAGISIGALVLATGAMHEDGLADCADGFWGGWDRNRRLEIMRDSSLGTYGTLALILSLGLRWGALATLFSQGHVFGPIIAAAALSRLPMIAIMRFLPCARGDGLANGLGRPPQDTLTLAAVSALLLALLATGFAALPAALAAGFAGLGVAQIARQKIQGQTGDVLGASQQISEIAVLIVYAMLAS